MLYVIYQRIQKLLHLKIVEFYELYYLIESRNIEIFESINVYEQNMKQKLRERLKAK